MPKQPDKMYYDRMDKLREREKLQENESEARRELVDILREARETKLPDLIGCGINFQLVIGAKEHRDAVKALLNNLSMASNDNEENEKLVNLATEVVAKIDAYEIAKEAVKTFDDEDAA
jgi:hypothetical protein